ncbi:MAG: insulinase family protein [Dysgonamonadaceae bacterium]|jgi:predicted Zn-dependent peptidase|nr:insulinase family protein [Dysgonamonadaceae bacterium]
MIDFNKYILPNGLRLLHHRDVSTAMVALNLVYNVGSRDENPEKTGFAHLFEHLMFGGSVHIPAYDTPAQEAGAENNAWTSDDVTCYYITLPVRNIETAFWLESDRMLSLAFSEQSLEVQKQVVIEEFKQCALNQPYGDVPHLIRGLTYQVHPYHWPTIGKEFAHIEQATLTDVRDFFFRYYAPDNAVLSVAGNISLEETIRLAEKWFAPINRRNVVKPTLPEEPRQTAPRFLQVDRHVPANAIYKAYHVCGRTEAAYHACDVLSDLLAHGRSARLYRHLVMEQHLFSEINAYMSGNTDPGLLYITGKPSPGVSLEKADKAIQTELQRISADKVPERELEKVKNKFESNDLFSNINYQSKATNLGLFELLGDASLINREVSEYRAVTPERLRNVAAEIFDEKNSSTLYYCALAR